MTQFFQIVQGKDPLEAGLLILLNGGAVVILTTISAGWSASTEILTIILFGFGFGLGMPSLTDMVMAWVPVEGAGVGSAVNDAWARCGVRVSRRWDRGLVAVHCRRRDKGAVVENYGSRCPF